MTQHPHAMNLRKYLVLLGVVVFVSLGDLATKMGMEQVGQIDVHSIGKLIGAVTNPYIFVGILFLMAFMACNMTALSFADLSYVLPATSLSYVLMLLLSIVFLHEHVSATRWAGVLLIVIGVGAVAGGPARTELPHERAGREEQP